MEAVDQTSPQGEVMNYKANLKYFKPRKLKWQIILIVVGLILLAPKGGAVFGVILIIIGVAIIVFKSVGRPSDQDIDGQFNLKIADIRKIAQHRLMLDDDQISMIDPLQFSGYRFDGAQVKKGKDGKMRSSLGEAMIIFFDEGGLHVFTYRFSILDPREEIGMNQYSYRDVVQVYAGSSADNVDNSSVPMETLTIELQGNQKVWITLPQSEDVLRSMQGARQLIMERKRQG